MEWALVAVINEVLRKHFACGEPPCQRAGQKETKDEKGAASFAHTATMPAVRNVCNGSKADIRHKRVVLAIPVLWPA
jgi:hypothetical protein